MALQDANYDKLRDALDQKDLTAAFECAHALKGILANLSLDPLLAPVSEMTEALRAKTDRDYTPLLQEMFRQLNLFRAMAE